MEANNEQGVIAPAEVNKPAVNEGVSQDPATETEKQTHNMALLDLAKDNVFEAISQENDSNMFHVEHIVYLLKEIVRQDLLLGWVRH